MKTTATNAIAGARKETDEETASEVLFPTGEEELAPVPTVVFVPSGKDEM